jgi:hypothetical protein
VLGVAAVAVAALGGAWTIDAARPSGRPVPPPGPAVDSEAGWTPRLDPEGHLRADGPLSPVRGSEGPIGPIPPATAPATVEHPLFVVEE